MNIFRYIVTGAFLLIPFTIASAGIVINPIKPSFSLEVKSVNKIMDSDFTEFNFVVVNQQNIGLVSDWELRLWCDKGVFFSTLSSMDNICNKNISIINLIKNNNFSLLYKNPSAEANKFKIKLKAFDSQNKWLSSTSKVFFWR